MNATLDCISASEVALLMDEANHNCRKFYGLFRNAVISWARGHMKVRVNVRSRPGKEVQSSKYAVGIDAQMHRS